MQDQKTYTDGVQAQHEEGEFPQEPLHDPSSSDIPIANVLNPSGEATSPEVLSAGDSGVKPYCRFFQRGYCRYGDDCRYSHDESAPISVPKFGVLPHPRSATPCRFFQKGFCRYGEQCKFAHQNGLISGGGGRFHQGNTNGLHLDAPTVGSPTNVMTAPNGKTWDEDSQENLVHGDQPTYY